MTNSFRIERDSMGELQVPADALWGAQTQRAVQNFPISGIPLPRAFIGALALVKQAAARANTRLELLDAQIAQAIDAAAADVAAGRHDEVNAGWQGIWYLGGPGMFYGGHNRAGLTVAQGLYDMHGGGFGARPRLRATFLDRCKTCRSRSRATGA